MTYQLTTRECGRLVSETDEADPFVTHRVHVRGWRNALRVLFRHYEVEIRIGADRSLVERVLELDPDYLGPSGSPSRTAWNDQLANALHDFAEPEETTDGLQD